ncbi:MAG: hypothetical protein JEZ12_24235 [Desulfobacterium sp.]|nr:hypothetical protein [Desulfobacterium sp.]
MMDVCPICKAAYAGQGTCHRCKSDLTRFEAIEGDAREELEIAAAAMKQKDYESALLHGKRSCSLKRSKLSERLIFYAKALGK